MTRGCEASAWVLGAGDPARPEPGVLVRETITLPPLEAGEVLAAPIYGCWEGNMGHAIARRPLDLCRHRGEDRIVIGNAGVVRVLETGADVTGVRAGQYGLVFPTAVEDRWGYTVKALGYDAPGSMGILATRMKLLARQVIPLPERTRYSLLQWAVFSVRYITAWSNWRLAAGVFRLQVPDAECPAPHVWGWGGGTTLAELDLAQRHGCRAVMLSGHDRHLATIAAHGVAAVDRRAFGALSWDEPRYEEDAAYRSAYKKAEVKFLGEVKRRTGGEMVQIFIDYIGEPVYRATLRALSRQGVMTSAGWKLGAGVTHSRAKECTLRRQHVYTHYASYREGVGAMAYGESCGWMPRVTGDVYSFDDIPRLAADYAAERTDYFPCFAINPE